MSWKRTNRCNIQEDEILAIEVEKYHSLYNEELKQYKETDRRKNALRATESELGYEEGIYIFSCKLYIYIYIHI